MKTRRSLKHSRRRKTPRFPKSIRQINELKLLELEPSLLQNIAGGKRRRKKNKTKRRKSKKCFSLF